MFVRCANISMNLNQIHFGSPALNDIVPDSMQTMAVDCVGYGCVPAVVYLAMADLLLRHLIDPTLQPVAVADVGAGVALPEELVVVVVAVAVAVVVDAEFACIDIDSIVMAAVVDVLCAHFVDAAADVGADVAYCFLMFDMMHQCYKHLLAVVRRDYYC